MKRTLFNLGKQSIQKKSYNTVQLASNGNAIAKLWDIFSNETREKIIPTFYKISIEEVQKNIQIGKSLMANRANRDLLGAIAAFEKSTKIADTIATYLSEPDSQSKLILARAYAGYADVLRKFEPEKIELRKEMVKKALELDPKNEIAKELRFDMRFYDISPEPPSI